MNVSQLTVDAEAQLAQVDRRSYTSFFDDLLAIANEDSISKIWFSSSASQAIFNRIPVAKRFIASRNSLFFVLKSSFSSRFSC